MTAVEHDHGTVMAVEPARDRMVAPRPTGALETRRPVSPKVRRMQVMAVGGCLVIGFLLLVFWRYIFVTILPGHVGVLYSWFFGGIQVDHIYGEGLAMKLPWNRIYIVETRVRVLDQDFMALSEEGMQVQVKFAVLFRVRPEMAGHLLKQIGPEFEPRVIQPIAVSAIRTAISRYPSQEFYTKHFATLEKDIVTLLDNSPYQDIIEFKGLIIRELTLPQTVTNAINEKLLQEQLTAAYAFRLEREKQEAERRRIEAIGIQNFYSIVSSALTPNLLTWRGIEATVEVARSPNSKVVIVGSGKEQLPLILGSDIHNMPAAAPVTGVKPSEAPAIDWSSLPSLFPQNFDTTGMSGSMGGVNTPLKPAPPPMPPAGSGSSAEPPTNSVTTGKPPLPTPRPSLRREGNETGLRAPDVPSAGLRSSRSTEGFRFIPQPLSGDPKAHVSPYGAQPQ